MSKANPDQDTVSVSDVCRVLNEAVEADPDAMLALVQNRVPCNEKLAEHPTIQVGADPDGGDSWENPRVGFLGVLNGLLGITDEGWGYISAYGECEVGEDGKKRLTSIEGFAPTPAVYDEERTDD